MMQAATSKRFLGGLDATNATRLVQASSDIALMLDEAGTILDMSVQDSELPEQTVGAWLGRPWVQTVTIESRQKVEAMLQDARATAGLSRWRQVNHPGYDGGEDLPLLYATVRLGEVRVAPGQAAAAPATSRSQAPAVPAGPGRILAFGRSLLATVALQKRLVQAQQTMERDYWRFREAETRYRHLFQTSSEAVLIIDALVAKGAGSQPGRACAVR
jgi:PAS domain-containing protein